MKWILLILFSVVVYSFVSGDTGGSSKFAQNYQKLMSNKTQE